MSVKYTLNIQNNSPQTGSFCVFQSMPDVNIPNVVCLAWLAKPAHPTTHLKFEWNLDYSFVWSTTTKLRPGTRVIANQSWDANLNTENKVNFDKTSGAYTFENQRQGSYEGNLYINQTQRVQSKEASVGIGMSGRGTFMVHSQPNMSIVMRPKPKYWLVFGDFKEGEVLDMGRVTETAYEIQFKGTTSRSVDFLADNTWRLLK